MILEGTAARCTGGDVIEVRVNIDVEKVTVFCCFVVHGFCFVSSHNISGRNCYVVLWLEFWNVCDIILSLWR